MTAGCSAPGGNAAELRPALREDRRALDAALTLPTPWPGTLWPGTLCVSVLQPLNPLADDSRGRKIAIWVLKVARRRTLATETPILHLSDAELSGLDPEAHQEPGDHGLSRSLDIAMWQVHTGSGPVNVEERGG